MLHELHWLHEGYFCTDLAVLNRYRMSTDDEDPTTSAGGHLAPESLSRTKSCAGGGSSMGSGLATATLWSLGRDAASRP
ncbi:hypothetical protein AVEN_191492-1 [Araneus ventricosus]|uniref:Uncharacterized protein n=1 Tax=Araneus ventricosus TaxID=182803 RepID=A0A4Y2RZ28_ARAVE|nr:hypothetical protein AVEN_191492-1 [Araneus ventricosus]